MTPTTPTPRERAIHLLADYATAQADLKAATAPYEAEATRIKAAISKATAAEKARIKELEEALEKLALEHGPEVFGPDRRTLIENGYKLQLTKVEEIALDLDETDLCRLIHRQLRQVERDIETAEAAGQHEEAQKLGFQRIALSQLITIETRLNRSYIKENFDDNEAWFSHFGIALEPKDSASLKPAPKPREPKAKKAPQAVPSQPVKEAA